MTKSVDDRFDDAIVVDDPTAPPASIWLHWFPSIACAG
jgi:hypothetical protein